MLSPFGMEASRSSEGEWTFTGVVSGASGHSDDDWVITDLNVNCVWAVDPNDLAATQWQPSAGPNALYSTENPSE